MNHPSPPASPPPVTRGTGLLSRIFLIAVLLILGGIFLYMTRMFFMPVIMAAVFAGLFHPLHRWILGRVKERRNLAALLTILILFIGLMIPFYAVGFLVALEAIDLYNQSETMVKGFLATSADAGVVETVRVWFESGPMGGLLERFPLDLGEALSNIARSTGKIVVDVINQTGRTTFQLVVNLIIMLFTMFFFFRDGHRLMNRLFYYSPLPQRYESMLVTRFLEVSRATVKGTLVIGLIQGALGTIPLVVFGVPSALLWGVIIVVLSIIPMVGGFIVLYPAAVYLILTGDAWQGVVLAVYTAVVVGNVDNLIRPRLVGQDAKLHDLLIFFSTVGGIAVFGVLGFIVGPILTALLVTLLEIYGTEFEAQLAYEETGPPVDTSREESESNSG